MIQQLSDHIDQLDLALDQLALRDRNYDRFALLLIDNVVELVLHQHAQDKNAEKEMWRRLDKQPHDPKALTAALGQHFDAKVAFAASSALITTEIADSIQRLHSFRNTAYHRGLRHEGILHSLALFYFRNACVLLISYAPPWWGWHSNDKISHRAAKYLGASNLIDPKKRFDAAWKRLDEVAVGMGDTLVADLHSDMQATIDRADREITFLLDGMPEGSDRDDVVISSQAWPFAFTEEGKACAKNNSCPERLSVSDYVTWLADNYPWIHKRDPIPSWKSRLSSLEKEKSPHQALTKYSEFIGQTEKLREQLSESAAQYDAEIQRQIDVARGK